MSLFDDFVKDLGQTVESLAQDVGIDSHLLGNMVNDLASNNINIIPMASKLGLTPVSFLRNVFNLMNSDPHQILLQHLVGPIQSAQDPLDQLSQQWTQMAMLHQNTAQTIQKHIDDLCFGNGNYSYTSPAATALLETNTTYQQYFTNILVNHAHTQGTRHASLSGNVSDYLNQMPGKVHNISTPMAALGVLTFETIQSPTTATATSTTDAPPQWLADAIQAVETGEQNLGQDLETTESVVPGPENLWGDLIVAIMLIIGVILLLLGICWCVWWLWDHVTNHQNQQNSTTTPTTPAKPTPTPLPLKSSDLTPAQQEEVSDILADATKAGYSVDQSDVEAMVKLGYSRAAILAMIKAGDLKNSVGKSYTTSSGHTYPAHTSDHIGVPAKDLEDRASKKNKDNGAGLATSFPNDATAQNAVNFAIANNKALQDFILAAVPGSSIQEVVCDTSQDFGYGYKRNNLKDGTINNPPTSLPHLHCVLVWMAVDADGNVFVVDAYPTVPPAP